MTQRLQLLSVLVSKLADYSNSLFDLHYIASNTCKVGAVDRICRFKVVENFYQVVGGNLVAEMEKRDSFNKESIRYLSLLM